MKKQSPYGALWTAPSRIARFLNKSPWCRSTSAALWHNMRSIAQMDAVWMCANGLSSPLLTWTATLALARTWAALKMASTTIGLSSFLNFFSQQPSCINATNSGRWIICSLSACHLRYIRCRRTITRLYQRVFGSAWPWKRIVMIYMHYFLKQATKDRLPMKVIEAQATVLILAGSETSSVAETAAVYHILANPSIHRTLQKEIWTTFSSIEDITLQDVLHKLPYLDAVVRETLRIHAPLANGFTRWVPNKNGAIICGKQVPQDVSTTLHIQIFGNQPIRKMLL